MPRVSTPSRSRFPSSALAFLTYFTKREGRLHREIRLIVGFKHLEGNVTIPVPLGGDAHCTPNDRMFLIEYHAHGKVVYCYPDGTMTNPQEAAERAMKSLGLPQ